MTRPSPQSTAVAIAGGIALLFGARSLTHPSDRRFTPADCTLVIDVNRAGAAELALLPQIGPILAQAIVDERDRRRDRAFRSLDDLASVPGIGPVAVREIAERVCFGDPCANASPNGHKSSTP